MQQSLHEFSMASDEIKTCFSPAIRRIVVGDDTEWNQIKAKLERRARQSIIRDLFSRRYTERAVKRNYERTWNPEMALSRLDLSLGSRVPTVWGDRRYFANSMGKKKVHLLFLMRLIDALKPTRILEVGSGTGQNLFILAARFPDISFAGAELTEAGFRTAEVLRSSSQLPKPLFMFSPQPIQDLNAHCRVELFRASATELPFPDHHFDLVYTVQALEQMEEIRDRAMFEIARICGGNIVMFEPFSDWNKTKIRRDKIRSHRYFSGAIADLKKYALQTIFTTEDMPTNLNYGIGLVVAKSC